MSHKIDWTTIKLGRVLYKNYSIDRGVTNWNNNRTINIPLSALAPIGISQGDVAKVEFSGRFNNDTYRTIFGITVSNSLSALSDMGYHVEQQDQDNIVSAGFSALSTVDSSGITVELTANDYTRSDSLGTIIIQKLLSATEIS